MLVFYTNCATFAQLSQDPSTLQENSKSLSDPKANIFSSSRFFKFP